MKILFTLIALDAMCGLYVSSLQYNLLFLLLALVSLPCSSRVSPKVKHDIILIPFLIRVLHHLCSVLSTRRTSPVAHVSLADLTRFIEPGPMAGVTTLERG